MKIFLLPACFCDSIALCLKFCFCVSDICAENKHAFCSSVFSFFKIVYLIDPSGVTAISQITVASHGAVHSLHYCASL